MKIVLDTNILVSGFALFKHPDRSPAQIIHLWQDEFFELCISEHILQEVERTLQDPYFQNRLNSQNVKIEEIMTLLKEDCTLVSNIVQISGIATHPEDDLIIATAITAKADYLVTGDKPLINKIGPVYHGVKLLTPNEFIQKLII